MFERDHVRACGRQACQVRGGQAQMFCEVMFVQPGDRGLQDVSRGCRTPWLTPVAGARIRIQGCLGLRPARLNCPLLCTCQEGIKIEIPGGRLGGERVQAESNRIQRA